jgi:hypothetical protein
MVIPRNSLETNNRVKIKHMGLIGIKHESRELFHIADHAVNPLQLPTAADCANHLKLLNAFVTLRSRVMLSSQEQSVPFEEYWRCYLTLAVVRFTIWLHFMQVVQSKIMLPPLGKA